MKRDGLPIPEVPILLESVKTYKAPRFAEAKQLRANIDSTFATLSALSTVQCEIEVVDQIRTQSIEVEKNLVVKMYNQPDGTSYTHA